MYRFDIIARPSHPIGLCTKFPQYTSDSKLNFLRLHSSVNGISKQKTPTNCIQKKSLCPEATDMEAEMAHAVCDPCTRWPKLQRSSSLVTHGRLLGETVMCQVKVIAVMTRGSPAQGWVTPGTRWRQSLLQGVTRLPNLEQQGFQWEVTSSTWKGPGTVTSPAVANLWEGTGAWKVKKPRKDQENMAGWGREGWALWNTGPNHRRVVRTHLAELFQTHSPYCRV